MSGEWKQGLCNFCEDSEICCCGTFCWPCLIYKNAENLGKSGIIYTLLGCMVPCVPIMLLRQEARERYNIEGEILNDAVASACLGSCVMCQTAVEIKTRGDEKV